MSFRDGNVNSVDNVDGEEIDNDEEEKMIDTFFKGWRLSRAS